MAARTRTRTRKSTPAKRTTYYIANRNPNMGDIVFPKIMDRKTRIITTKTSQPFCFVWGVTTPIAAEDWEALRKRPGIKMFLDQKILTEEDKPGEITMIAKNTVNPIIPEILQTEAEVQSGETGLKASVKRRNVAGIATLPPPEQLA